MGVTTATPVRKVLLTLQSSGRATSGEHLSFILPESFSDGYTNEWSDYAAGFMTHPTTHAWLSGKVDDVELELELVVGVSYKIRTPADLIRCVEILYDMALPYPGAPYTYSLLVTIHNGGSPWFTRNYFVLGIKAEMGAPYDVDSGRPMRAKVRLSLRPTYAPGKSGEASHQGNRPYRPYQFIRG